MSNVSTVLAPLLVLALWGLLVYRFGFLAGREIGGKASFVAGGLLLFLATGWQVVELSSGYGDWFVRSAYPAVNLAQFLVGALGVTLSVVGLALYADYWQVRKTEIEERYAKLSILDHLHHDSRQPYHLLELLNISLREILVHYPMASGAIFLMNRSSRQFVLTSSSGLKKEEIAALEYYPLERNLMSQSVELGDPILSSQFEFIGRDGQRVLSRFHSILLLPLSTGMKKIGCLALYSEESPFFEREDTIYLSPVAQWLAEKINTGRLERELTRTEQDRERKGQALLESLNRITRATRALVSADSAAAFCGSLVGLAGSESAHLCQVSQGELAFVGSSEPLLDLSESYRAAIIDAILRSKPLVINQESQENSYSRLVQSSLIYPLDPQGGAEALVLIKSNQAFAISDADRRQLDALASLGRLLLEVSGLKRSRLSSRKGFDAVLRLLQHDPDDLTDSQANALFVDTLSTALPAGSRCLTLLPEDDRRFWTIETERGELRLAVEDGELDLVVEKYQPQIFAGRSEVKHHVENCHDQARSSFQQLFGERGIPDLIAYCPLGDGTTVAAITLTLIYSVKEQESGEWERLIRLASSLHALRQRTSQAMSNTAGKSGVAPVIEAPEAIINQVNNLLSGVIGEAELVRQQDATPEVKIRLNGLVEKAEEVGRLLSSSWKSSTGLTDTVPVEVAGFNSVIRAELDRVRLSGDLYMAGQRPREVRANLGKTGPISFRDEPVRRLFQSVFNRFAAVAEDDDIMTIATYQLDGYVYLDISRHRRNFPPVERVADFGRYLYVPEALGSRPGDVYLRHLTEGESYYAVDSESPAPAFLSFKFPLAAGAVVPQNVSETPSGRLLAIDDQQVILDLMVAMGSSLGYQVDTAISGEDGLELAARTDYSVILTDLALPGLSGIEIAPRLRRLQPETPIILVTGWATKISRSDLEVAGIEQILHKPFRVEQLTAAVQSVIQQHS